MFSIQKFDFEFKDKFSTLLNVQCTKNGSVTKFSPRTFRL